MLELGPLRKQIKKMFQEKVDDRTKFHEKLKQCWFEMKKWEKNWETLKTRLDRAKTSWLVAQIAEPLDTKINASKRPKEMTVIATDGSQIFPDYHEISSCYLINIGLITLHYGTGEKPVLESKPILYYEDKDMYEQFDGKKISVSSAIVSARRSNLETEYLTELLIKNRDRKNLLGLADGTLILWYLEGNPPDFKEKIISNFLKQLDDLKKANIPVASYISRPRTNDVVNMLRVAICPEKEVSCDRCPYKNDLFIPCSQIEGVTDAQLFNGLLKEGERSPIFESTSHIISSSYRDHRIMFFYLHTGEEIGRVEIPSWVGENPDLMITVHSSVYDQVKKGGGYPIVLSEAHEKAVIRGNDREIFYRMVSDNFVEQKIPLKMSAKKASKERVKI